MSDENLSFKIDLDSKEMLEGLHKISEAIEELGVGKQLGPLISGLGEIAAVGGVIGAAYMALKTTFETVFDAEKIRQVNIQFEAMAESAGLVGDELKEALVSASKGLIDDTELMKAANMAMIELGQSSAKMPKIMELAHKTTAVFGGELIDRFEQIDRAIATGSTKMLRSVGLTIDAQKAYEKYAKSIGATAEMLDESGKKQAMLNAVLEAGEKRFGNVNDSALQANNTWEQTKVLLASIGETATLVFERAFGKTVRNALTLTKNSLQEFNTWFKSAFGEGAEKAKASIELTENKIKDLEGKLKELETTGQTFFNGTYVKAGTQLATDSINSMNAKLVELRSQIATTKKEIDKSHGGAGGEKPEVAKSSGIDLEKEKQERAKFEMDLVRLHEQAIQSQISATKSWSEQERLEMAKIGLEAEKQKAVLQKIAADKTMTEAHKNELINASNQAYFAKLNQMQAENAQKHAEYAQQQMQTATNAQQFEAALDAQKAAAKQNYDLQRQMVEQNQELTEQERKQRLLELEQQYLAKVSEMNQNYYQQKQAMIDREVYAQSNAASQFAYGFAAASKKASLELTNFGKQGEMVANTMSRHMSDAFVKMGEGAKSGSEVMKAAVFGMIADIAQQYGAMLLLTSIWPPNPLGLAAGAGLLVLSGFLRSKARGASGGMDMSASGGGGGIGMGSIGGVPSTLSAQDQMQQNQKQSKNVSLVVQGSIFDTDATRTRIAELVRQSVDATDFSIQRVGGGI